MDVGKIFMRRGILLGHFLWDRVQGVESFATHPHHFPSQPLGYDRSGAWPMGAACGVVPHAKCLRPELSKDSTDFESVWVEIENKSGKVIFFAVVTAIQAHPLIPSLNICKEFRPGVAPGEC